MCNQCVIAKPDWVVYDPDLFAEITCVGWWVCERARSTFVIDHLLIDHLRDWACSLQIQQGCGKREPEHVPVWQWCQEWSHAWWQRCRHGNKQVSVLLRSFHIACSTWQWCQLSLQIACLLVVPLHSPEVSPFEVGHRIEGGTSHAVTLSDWEVDCVGSFLP